MRQRSENKRLRSIMHYKDLLLHNLKLGLSNPNPSPCLLHAHQIVTYGDLIFCVIAKMEILRSIF